MKKTHKDIETFIKHNNIIIGTTSMLKLKYFENSGYCFKCKKWIPQYQRLIHYKVHRREDKKIMYKAIITASVVIGLLLINSANAITAENLEILKQRCLEYDFTHKPLTTSEAQDHFMNTICHPAGGEITAESYENAIKTLYMEELKKAFNR